MNEVRRTTPVKIKIDHHGCGSVEIGGRKLESYTTGITIITQVGEVPKVLLDLVAFEGLDVELDALVDVQVRDSNAESIA